MGARRQKIEMMAPTGAGASEGDRGGSRDETNKELK